MSLLGMKKYLHLIEQYQGSWKCNQLTIGEITAQKYNPNIVSIYIINWLPFL